PPTAVGGIQTFCAKPPPGMRREYCRSDQGRPVLVLTSTEPSYKVSLQLIHRQLCVRVYSSVPHRDSSRTHVAADDAAQHTPATAARASATECYCERTLPRFDDPDRTSPSPETVP